MDMQLFILGEQDDMRSKTTTLEDGMHALGRLLGVIDADVPAPRDPQNPSPVDNQED